ncbi:MAG: YheC/YheD family protein [Candidatus Micrarchaeia archaeon]
MKSLLVLGKGDTTYSDRNRKRVITFAQNMGIDVKTADYHELDTVSDFKTDKINVMFFFPFTFWNNNCETPKDTKLYGTSKSSYTLFRDFFINIKTELEDKFGAKRLNFIIEPEKAAIDRDKLKTVEILRDYNIPTTETLEYYSIQDLIDRVSNTRAIFIKCRYGAEGKGITVMHRKKWVTNYKVEKGKLINYKLNGLWPFTDITGQKSLIYQLLEQDVIVELEILTPKIYNNKFDVRAYSIGNKAPHFFIRLNEPVKEITNFSQGGKVIHHPYTTLSEHTQFLIKKITLETANAIGLKFVGVDIMFDKKLTNPKVVELQAFTDFPSIIYFDLAEYMIKDEVGLLI